VVSNIFNFIILIDFFILRCTDKTRYLIYSGQIKALYQVQTLSILQKVYMAFNDKQDLYI